MYSKKKRRNSIFVRSIKNENRIAYRYEFPETGRLKAKINNNEYEIINISAAGLAIKNKDLKAKTTYEVTLSFPEDSMLIKASINVLYIDKADICRCEFVDLTQKVKDDLHQYIFEKQMMDIRNKSFVK